MSSHSYDKSELITLTGCVSAVIFDNPDNDYCVLQLRQSDQDTVITGPLGMCCVGDYLTVSGQWVSHPVHKQQFKVSGFDFIIPRSTHELMVFLSSGVITGVGPHFAQQMATLFGDQLIYILDKDPQQLNKINGIGSKKIEGIVVFGMRIDNNCPFCNILCNLISRFNWVSEFGLYYHDDAMQLCQTNPYQMIRDIRGMTFQMADRIAMDQPDLRHSSVRFNAVIDDIFYAYHQTANVWMKGASFLDQVMQRLDIDSDVLDGLVQQHVLAQDLVWITDDDQHQWVTLPHLSHGECRIMDEVQQLYDAKATIDIQPQVAVDWVQGRGQFELSLDQVSALEGVLSHSVSILYGGPGTGKTTLLNAYVQIVSKKPQKLCVWHPLVKRLSDWLSKLVGEHQPFIQ